ncbi:HAMP domain-containing histidine kinase [Schnuerera sp. xch1]|uniref:sensor histidine kinase n=1 Tax=Schnuerera sp. xch1 TaxID=2874283 RepID=UPI001CBC916F|nr:HAMP domain-containing sensor histidine kinase [Schnuerera sp. xch1]MBZ2175400.1 HAMP domain-containing histidine kinase [Schnuerera sp. xch1]
MEKKIYQNLAIVATVTAIITASVTAFLFYDLYNANILNRNINFVTKFLYTLPVITGVLVFILILLYFVAHILTKSIIEPISIATKNIESILSGRDEIKNIEVYEELNPFMETIQTQKKEIETYILKLKEAEKSRRDFTANISHELKTPLTSINGFAEMLSTGNVNKEDAIKFANIIHKEGIRLLELIDSIINLSRIEHETENKKMEIMNISDIANEVVSQLKVRAKKKNLSLNIIAENTSIQGSRRMIRDLLYNLIDNSIKYNKLNGKIEVFIKQVDDYCVIKVRDTGIGIPHEQQEKVFERFYMVDKSRSKKVDGSSGLGLSMVKHIVKYHGGKISLKSKINEGTDIKIQLPIKKSHLN